MNNRALKKSSPVSPKNNAEEVSVENIGMSWLRITAIRAEGD